MKDFGLPRFDANLLVERPEKAELFEAVLPSSPASQNISNWLNGDVSRLLNEKNINLSDTKLTAQNLARMIQLIESGEISMPRARRVIEEILFTDKSADEVVKEKGLAQISDTSALEAI